MIMPSIKMRRAILPITFLTLLIAFFGCSENDGNVGTGINDPGFSGTVVDTVIYPPTTYNISSLQVNSGQSLHLYIGANSGFETKFLIKFSYFLTLPDSFRVDSAYYKMFSTGIFGDTTLTYPDFQVSVYQPTEVLPSNDWYESNLTWDSVSAWDNVSLYDFTVSANADTDSIYFALDTALVNHWLYADTTDPNMGMIFDYSGDPQFIKKFMTSENSADTLYKPQMMVYFTPFDSISADSGWIAQEPDSVIIYVTNDVYIGRDTSVLSSNMLYLGRTQSYRSLLLCDLTDIFPTFGTFINKMQLVLFADTNNQLLAGDYDSSVRPAKLANTNWIESPNDAEFSSFSGSYYIITGDSITVDISSWGRNWVEHPDSNYGVAVMYSGETGYLARLPLFPPDYDDLSKRPYLKVLYSEMEE